MAYPVDSGVTTMSGKYIPEIWSGKLLTKFYAATVFGAIANTDYSGEITNMGDKVKIRTVPNITINDYAIGQNLSYERPDPSVVELLIDKGKYYGFSINEVEKKQADIAYVEKWSDDAGEQLKIAIDTGILNSIYADAVAANKGTSAGAISGDLDLGTTAAAVSVTKANSIDKLVELGQVLDEQNVPENDRWVVLPAWYGTRLKTSDLKDASLTGDGKSVLRNGRIGMIDRFEVFLSNNLTPITDGTKCFHVLAGHKSALTFASQLVKNEMIDNPNDFGQLVRGLQVYGYEVIKPEALVDFYCTPG